MGNQQIHAVLERVLPAPFPRTLASIASRLLGLNRAAETYLSLKADTGAEPIPEKLLRHLEVTYSTSEGDLQKIPRAGPTIVVANHPYGILEGAVLATMLLQLRADVRILANGILAGIPELAGLVIPIELDNRASNPRGVRQALRHLRQGGLLVVFPAGEVAHFEWKRVSVSDPPWNDGVARLIEIAGASGCKPAVVPVFIDGRNGALFQAAGVVHSKFRTALLARELMNKRRAAVKLRIGSPIDADRLLSFSTNTERTEYLRWRTEILASRDSFHAKTRRPLSRIRPPAQVPVADETPAGLVASEVRSLSPCSLLLDSGHFQVYLAKAGAIPNALREIGRLREITFRAEGEGTGRALDLDRFDLHYWHLFVWNSQKREIAGAYRLAITSDIVHERGVEGLYTATLFNYGFEFLQRVGPSIELGRSFVRAEYQRTFSPLLLLWKGIGRFVADHPECKCLFGPVSVSNQYRAISRELIIRFFERTGSLQTWTDLVRARNAPPRPKVTELCWDFEDLSTVVADLEPTRAGVPVLLRQYVRLGGQLLGFNIDPEFSGALDGLILVDLTRTGSKLLERYLGKEAATRFLEFNGAKNETN